MNTAMLKNQQRALRAGRWCLSSIDIRTECSTLSHFVEEGVELEQNPAINITVQMESEIDFQKRCVIFKKY